jgi:hypothetical protein
MGDGDDTYPEDTPKLWISAKGKTLIEEIAIESGWVFDPKCENPTHPAHFLHLRCINTIENNHVEKRERTND